MWRRVFYFYFKCKAIIGCWWLLQLELRRAEVPVNADLISEGNN
jgi:hypothetical protein